MDLEKNTHECLINQSVLPSFKMQSVMLCLKKMFNREIIFHLKRIFKRLCYSYKKDILKIVLLQVKALIQIRYYQVQGRKNFVPVSIIHQTSLPQSRLMCLVNIWFLKEHASLEL